MIKPGYYKVNDDCDCGLNGGCIVKITKIELFCSGATPPAYKCRVLKANCWADTRATETGYCYLTEKELTPISKIEGILYE